MSETTANRGRGRRRVSRQAGPAAVDMTIEVQESSAARVSPVPAAVEPVVAPAADPEPEAGVVEDAVVAAPAESEPEVVSPPSLTKETVPQDDSSAAVDGDPVAGGAADAEAGSVAGEQPKSRIRKLTASLGRVGTVAAVVALLSALVLIGSGGVFFYHQHRADQLSQRRDEYIQVAKQAYVNMSTVSDATAGQDIDRLLAMSGGGLKDEYAQNRDAYKKIFEQLKVQSTGKVLAAALESDDADSASVLLLAQQTVSNVGTNGPMQRDYRVRVHVTRTGDTVTASSLEFVP